MEWLMLGVMTHAVEKNELKQNWKWSTVWQLREAFQPALHCSFLIHLAATEIVKYSGTVLMCCVVEALTAFLIFGGGEANQQPWEWVKRWSVILLGYRFFFHVVEAQNHYFIFRLPLTVMYLRRNFSRCCCLELDFVSLPITLKCTNVMYIMEYKGCIFIL